MAAAALGKLTGLVLEKPGKKFFTGRTQFRLSQSYSMLLGFVCSFAWVPHNARLRVTDKV